MPSSELDLPRLAKCINKRTYTVVAVAEGYGRAERQASSFNGSAAHWLLYQLQQTGDLNPKKKVWEQVQVCCLLFNIQ